MECVILFREPNGHVSFVASDGGKIMVFANMDEAIAMTDTMRIFQAGWPFQIVELSEL